MDEPIGRHWLLLLLSIGAHGDIWASCIFHKMPLKVCSPAELLTETVETVTG